jgi:hypothetical protein
MQYAAIREGDGLRELISFECLLVYEEEGVELPPSDLGITVRREYRHVSHGMNRSRCSKSGHEIRVGGHNQCFVKIPLCSVCYKGNGQRYVALLLLERMMDLTALPAAVTLFLESTKRDFYARIAESRKVSLLAS